MEVLMIPILALTIPIVIVPTALAFKHARFLREVKHRERMRAMELGRALPEDELFSSSRISAGIGAGVPLGSLFIAWLADLTSSGDTEAIWVASGVVAVGGLLCGTFLAARHIATRNQFAASQNTLKPEYDPDAYDVVGSRG